MDEQLVPIGRFATTTRLSVKALRHYDAIGLLEPARVDPDSGYRYYALGQANRAEAIRVLRGVDMPLDQIAEVLQAIDGSSDVVRKVLDEHRRHLSDELDRHRRMLAFLERLLTNEETLMPYDITVQTLPATAIASIRERTSIEEISSALETGFGRVFGALAERGQTPTGAPLVIYHEMSADEPGEIEIGLPCAGELDLGEGVEVRSLDEVDAAVTVHHGPYDELAPAYHALTNWMAEHGHEAAGPPREVYVTDPGETPDDELQTRIEWPIR